MSGQQQVNPWIGVGWGDEVGATTTNILMNYVLSASAVSLSCYNNWWSWSLPSLTLELETYLTLPCLTLPYRIDLRNV